MIRAGADFSQMKTEMSKATGAVQEFQSKMGGILKKVAIGFGALKIGEGLVSATKDAILVEASMQTLSRTLGANAGEFMTWANSTAAAFNISKSAAIRYGATYSNLVSGFSSGTKEAEQRTVDLLKAAAVVASGTGRGIDDVLERIRSGLLGNTEAIEDLGINVNVAMLQSTDAFKRFANGKSWDKLDFQTQQTIRYFGIMEQAATKFGAELNNNTGTKLGAFQTSLANIKLALGQAFLPILNVVLPLLTTMSNAILGVVKTISAFMSALFGYSDVQKKTTQTNNQAAAVAGLGDAYKDAGAAAAKASKGVASFDEVHNLSKDSGAGGAGAGAGAGAGGGVPGGPNSPVSALEPISKKVQEFANKIRQAFKDMADDPNVKKFAETLDGLKDSFKGLGDAIDDFFSSPNVQKFLDWMGDKLWESFWNARASDSLLIQGWTDQLTGVLDVMTGLVNLDWGKVKEGLGEIWAGIKEVWDGTLTMLGIDSEGFWETLFHVDDFKQIWENTKTEFATVKKFVSEFIADLSSAEFWSNLGVRFGEVWTDIKNATAPAWKPVAEAIQTAWKGITGSTWWADMKTVWSGIWEGLRGMIGEAWTLISTAISDAWNYVVTGDWWDDIVESLGLAWTAVKDAVAPAWVPVSDAIKLAWSSITSGSWWKDVTSSVGTVWTNIKNGVGEKWDLIKEAVSGKWKELSEIDLSSVKDAVAGVWTGIKNEAKTMWDGIINVVKGAFGGLITSINSFFDKIGSISIAIPSIDIPGIGKIGGGTIGLPKLPHIPALKNGGITNGKMLAQIGDNVGGREVVSPLDDLVDIVTSAVGTAVMAANQFNGGGGKQPDIVIQVEGTTLARVIAPYSAKEGTRVGGTMITTK